MGLALLVFVGVPLAMTVGAFWGSLARRGLAAMQGMAGATRRPAAKRGYPPGQEPVYPGDDDGK